MRKGFFAGRTAVLVLGEIPTRQSLHRHLQVELFFALDGPVDVLDGNDRLLRGTGFIIPPLGIHAVQAYGGRFARLYFTIGYECLTFWRGQGICTVAEDNVPLKSEIECFFSSDRSPEDAAHVTDRWLRAWLIPRKVEPAFDPRVAGALTDLESRDSPVQADRRSLAKRAGLSPTRFAALFADHTGMSLSRYLISMRVRAGLLSVVGGHSITAAAASVGFSDSAHFTRSCRATYGFVPSHVSGLGVTMVEPSAFGKDPLTCLSPRTLSS